MAWKVYGYRTRDGLRVPLGTAKCLNDISFMALDLMRNPLTRDDEWNIERENAKGRDVVVATTGTHLGPLAQGGKKVEYTILRKGANAYNQGRQLGWVPITQIEAATREEALTEARQRVTTYANQTLDAVTRFPRGFTRSTDGSYWEK